MESACSLTMFDRSNEATVEAVAVERVGTRCTIEVNRSITTNRKSDPRELGNGPTKSKPTDSQGRRGKGRGLRRPAGRKLEDFERWQVVLD